MAQTNSNYFVAPKKDDRPKRGRPPGSKNKKTLEAEKKAEKVRKNMERPNSCVRKYFDNEKDEERAFELEHEFWQSHSVDWPKMKEYWKLMEFDPSDLALMDDPKATGFIDHYIEYLHHVWHGNEAHYMEYIEDLFGPYKNPQDFYESLITEDDLEAYDTDAEVKSMVDAFRDLGAIDKMRKYRTDKGDEYKVFINGKEIEISDQNYKPIEKEVEDIIRGDRQKLLECCRKHYELFDMYLLDVEEMFDKDPEYYTYRVADFIAFDIWNHIYFGRSYTVPDFNIDVRVESDTEKSSTKKAQISYGFGGDRMEKYYGRIVELAEQYCPHATKIYAGMAVDIIWDLPSGNHPGLFISPYVGETETTYAGGVTAYDYLDFPESTEDGEMPKRMGELDTEMYNKSNSGNGVGGITESDLIDYMKEMDEMCAKLQAMQKSKTEKSYFGEFDANCINIINASTNITYGAEMIQRELDRSFKGAEDVMNPEKYEVASLIFNCVETFRTELDKIERNMNSLDSFARTYTDSEGRIALNKSVSFKGYDGTWTPLAQKGHYTIWKCNEEPNAYNIVTQTKKNSKTGKLVEKIIMENVDEFKDEKVQKMFGVKNSNTENGFTINKEAR